VSDDVRPAVSPIDMTGRVCVVTGGTRGIGASLALALADAGASVCVFGRDADRMERFITACLTRFEGRFEGVAVDVADPTGVRAAFEQVAQRMGPVDCLINNAGINKVGESLDYDLGDFARILEVNVTGLFACSQAAARQMAAGAGGSIVNIASISSFIGQPERAAYVASKSAVLGLTRALAVEWGPLGVRVNAVAPGYIETDLTRDLIERGVISPAAIANRTPLRRFGQTADLVGAVLLLLSPHSEFVTGQVLPVDGGWLANGYFK
jgi:NAD(P)-dependent dehydrogenase (short-subunit alcohol dehydrogenase family)